MSDMIPGDSYCSPIVFGSVSNNRKTPLVCFPRRALLFLFCECPFENECILLHECPLTKTLRMGGNLQDSLKATTM